MQVYYNILEMIRVQLLQDVNVNTVTTGDIFDVDLEKQTIFPLSHVMVNQATKRKNVYTLSISVLLMDIVDSVSHEAIDNFRGNDNEQDVFNTQLSVGARLVEMIERGDIRDDNFELVGDPSFEPFTERFENSLAGWSLTFEVNVPNTMTVCDAPLIPSDCAAASYTITDEDGTTLYSGDIASGLSLTQTITNSDVQNSDGSYNAGVAAQGSLTLPDETILVTNTNLDIIAQDVNRPSVKDGTIEVPDITLTDSDGTVLSKAAGIDLVCTPSADATVENSDLSYTNTVASGGTLVLPDVTNTDSDGSSVVTPAQTPFVCTPAVPPTPQLYQAAKVIQTGQTVSYTTGDDITRGRGVDFFTLDYVNEWGHSFRFCGSNGGYSDGTSYFDVSGVATTRALAFPNLIVFDFSARNVDSVLSYYIGDVASYGNQATQIVKHLTSTFGGLTGWRLWNVSELFNVLNIGVYPIITHYMSYPPFDFGSANRYFWTASSYSATNGFRTELRGITPIVGNGNTSTYLGVWVRYTTLTELGL